jgi:predicted  nucleic acid-binding Zn-ribbon protein
MTPSEITAILERLTRIESKLDTQGDALTEIRREVKKTNGRVTDLETREAQDRARLDERTAIERARGDQFARWVPPLIIGLLIVTLGAAVVALLNLNAL